MEYINYMSNLRHALSVVASKVPEILNLIENKAIEEGDKDLEIALLPDQAWYILQRQYEEIEPKLYRFNPDEEYGIVRTMPYSSSGLNL